MPAAAAVGSERAFSIKNLMCVENRRGWSLARRRKESFL